MYHSHSNLKNDEGLSLFLLGRYFDYLFYVDFEASMADEVAQNALRHLEVKPFLLLGLEKHGEVECD